MQNPQQIEAKAEARHKIILMIWFALLMSVSIMFVMTVFIQSSNPNPNSTLSLALVAAAFMSVVGSVVLKSKVVQSAIESRDAAKLQSGYITGFALCEAAALLGLLDHFLTGSKYFYISFALAALGMLLHFPRKDHVRSITT